MLFTRYLEPDGGLAVINVDDDYGRQLAAECGAGKSLRFSLDRAAGAEVRLLDSTLEPSGMELLVQVQERELSLASQLVGRVNLSNILAAVGVAAGIGLDPEHIVRGIQLCPPVPGRLERVAAGSPCVIVDYAHTPDALERACETLREIFGAGARLIVVFGCGGNRDRGKRPLMGAAVARYADLAVVTSDNPRDEDPMAIIQEIEVGMKAMEKRYTVKPDRRLAIEHALAEARANDVVLIAGKGHEDYQEIAGERLHFDDRELARTLLT